MVHIAKSMCYNDDMIYDYRSHIRKSGANVYFVAEGDERGNILKTTINPANPLCQCYSVSKAYTALAVGICSDRGLLSPETKITRVLRDFLPRDYDPKWDQVTIDNLLRHRSGLMRGVLDIDSLDATELARPIISRTLLPNQYSAKRA